MTMTYCKDRTFKIITFFVLFFFVLLKAEGLNDCKKYESYRKEKSYEVTGGLTCSYSKTFFGKNSNNSYYQYTLNFKLILTAKDGKYYFPLESDGNGNYSFCNNKGERVTATMKYNGIIGEIFSGKYNGPVYISYEFNSNKPIYGFNDNALITYNRSDRDFYTAYTYDYTLYDYYKSIIDNKSGNYCAAYMIASHDKYNVEPIAISNYNPASNILNTEQGYLYHNFNKQSDAFDFMNPREYELDEKGENINGITELLPIASKSTSKVAFTDSQEKIEKENLAELYSSATALSAKCTTDEANKLSMAIDTKLKNIDSKDPKGIFKSDSNYKALAEIRNVNMNSTEGTFNSKVNPCTTFSVVKDSTEVESKSAEIENINDCTALKKEAESLKTLFDTKISALESMADKSSVSSVLSAYKSAQKDLSKIAESKCSKNNLAELKKSLQSALKKVIDAYDNWAAKNAPKIASEALTCEDLGGKKLIMEIFKYITIIGVILLIVFGVLDFSKATLSGDDDALKKAGIKFGKRVVAAIILFLLPTIVGLIIDVGVSAGIFGEQPVDCFVEEDNS